MAAFAGTAVLAAGAVGYGFFQPGQQDKLPPQVTAILAQAWQAWTQGSPEGHSQAIGLYRRATEIAPEFADGWGFLGCAYADKAHLTSGQEKTALRARATEAGSRALEIDRHNAYGRLALAYAQPIRGNWLAMEQEFGKVAEQFPGNWLAVYSLGLHMTRVGRNREAAEWFDKIRNNAPTVFQYFLHTQALWAAGRPDQAERLLNEATTIFSTHPVIWIARFQMQLFGGSAAGALAMTQSRDNRPAVADDVLSWSQQAAQAAVSRDPGDIEDLMEMQARLARQSATGAQAAFEFACLFGRIDTAIEIARALFLSDGYAIPDSPGSADVTLESRDTRLLFLATTQPVRADPRFGTLVDDFGLARYWRESSSVPDYQA
jgi:tetratricopeptide (TPR) repeat protein